MESPITTTSAWDLLTVSPAVRHRFACLAARWRRDQGLCSDVEFKADVLASASRCGLHCNEDPFAAEYFVDVPVATGAAKSASGLLLRRGRSACVLRMRDDEDDEDETEDEDDDVQGKECSGLLRRCKAVRDLLAAARHETAPDDCDDDDTDADADDDESCDEDDYYVLVSV